MMAVGAVTTAQPPAPWQQALVLNTPLIQIW